MKTVYKPWGKEEWLELNDKYCYKRLYINQGHKTSFQYHEVKQETNYIISGTAEVWLENDKGEIIKTMMSAGEYFSVLPPQKHRIIALTDLILQEVSTPEVDDVIRIEDDANRTSGRLDHEHMKPVLCIVAAGRGTRMGKIAKHINKGLLPINNKAIISDIIDKTPKDFEIVIALGYKSQQVIEYCEAAHPDRTFEFIQIKNYAEKGNGPGATLLQCKKHLQRPFYFITADCLIKEDLPPLNCNWLGMHPTSIPEIYSSGKVTENLDIVDFSNKKDVFVPSGYKGKDKYGFNHAFIGLCGILDFELFWNELESNMGDTGEMVSAFYNIKKYNAKAKILSWYDVGTIENYIKAQQTFQSPKFGIPKTNGQFLYKVGDRCVKIFQNSVKEKIHRAKNLNGYVPKLVYEGQNTIAYKWIQGDTLYDAEQEKIGFINWIGSEMISNKIDKNIADDCFKFYHDKSMNRLTNYLDKKESSFKGEHIINNKKCDSIFKCLDRVQWDELCTSTISTKIFHGDLQFDNIIKTDDGYKFIDWRDNFGDSIDYADSYYDLAKLYGGICMNYSFMKDETNYEFIKSGNQVQYKFKVDENVDYLKRSFHKLCKIHKFDFIKIQKLTALIYLNMAPLHDNGFDDLLFFHATKLLNEIYDA